MRLPTLLMLLSLMVSSRQYAFAQEDLVFGDEFFPSTLVEVEIELVATTPTKSVTYSQLVIVRSFGKDDSLVGQRFLLESFGRNRINALGPPCIPIDLRVGDFMVLWVKSSDKGPVYDPVGFGLSQPVPNRKEFPMYSHYDKIIALGEVISKIRRSTSEKECDEALKSGATSSNSSLAFWCIDLMIRWRPTHYIPFLENTFHSDQSSWNTKLVVDDCLQEVLKKDWTLRESRHSEFKEMASSLFDNEHPLGFINYIHGKVQSDNEYSDGADLAARNNLEIIQILIRTWHQVGKEEKSAIIEVCGMFLAEFPSKENKLAIETLISDAVPRLSAADRKYLSDEINRLKKHINED